MTDLKEKEKESRKRDLTPPDRRSLMRALSEQKVKTKKKNNLKSLIKMKSLPVSDSANSGSTPLGSTNISNIMPTTISPSRPRRKRVSFVPNYKLVNYVYYNPKDPIEDEKIEEKEEYKLEELDKTKKDNEKDRTVIKENVQCTCIIY